jgi:hypothetical protein
LKKRTKLLDIDENEKINFITINNDIDRLSEHDINIISKLILLNKQE